MKPNKEQMKILKSNWVKLYLLNGMNVFDFWENHDDIVMYWKYSSILHTSDVRAFGYIEFESPPDSMATFKMKFTDKFIDEVVNAE